MKEKGKKKWKWEGIKRVGKASYDQKKDFKMKINWKFYVKDKKKIEV